MLTRIFVLPLSIALLVVTISEGQHIEVTLVNARTGKPAPNATVGIRFSERPHFEPKQGAPAGVFISPELEPGDYELVAKGRGYIEKQVEGVRVQEGQTTKVTIRLIPAGAIRGRVVNEEGEGVGGMDFWWSGPEADTWFRHATWPDGTFVFSGGVGAGTIEVKGDYYRSRHRIEVAPGSNPPITLTVKTHAALRLQVPDSALPKEEVKVVLRNLEFNSSRAFQFRTSWVKGFSEAERREEARMAIAGSLDVPPLLPGRYHVEATWDGKTLGSMDLTLEAGKTKVVIIDPTGPMEARDRKKPSETVNLPEVASADKDEPSSDPLYVDITWDREKDEGRILIKEREFTLLELKAWLYPIARSMIEKETGFSNASLVIRCDKHAPFRLVQQVLTTCADRDIQIYKVYLAVERKRPGKKPVQEKLATFLPTRAHPPDKIRITLVIKNDLCLAYVNGRCVGPLPDARTEVREMLKDLNSGPDAMAQIEPGAGVRHWSVVTIVDECRRAKISRIAFSPVED
jgi:biopolymer transport protein ExbD